MEKGVVSLLKYNRFYENQGVVFRNMDFFLEEIVGESG